MKVLDNKKAIVTGGSSGIGKAIALAFLENGADVAIFARNEEKAKLAVKDLESKKKLESQKIFYKIVDVSDTKKVEEAILDVESKMGGIDILVNNAGITKDGFLIKMSEDSWNSVIDTNLKSIFNTSKIVSRLMMKKRSGKIINISSVIGLIGNLGQTNYAASKAGIIGFTKALAKEVASKNIFVNCIAPGFIETKMTDKLPEKIKDDLLNNIPLKRFGKPKDVANLALFLASYNSDYITGQVICVSGGMVM